MCIRDLVEQFEIQGAYHIKEWDDNIEDYVTLARGGDFEVENWDIKEEYFDMRIAYMYAVDGVLNIEVFAETEI